MPTHQLIRCASPLPLLMLLSVSFSDAFPQTSVPARELKFQEHFASRTQDPTTYCVVRNNFFRALSTRTAPDFIKRWLVAHPNATTIPVSKMDLARPEIASRPFIYV